MIEEGYSNPSSFSLTTLHPMTRAESSKMEISDDFPDVYLIVD
jgi:hypothetical protein